MKKILAIILTVLLMVSVCPLGLFSITASAESSGETGNCTWSLDGTVLTIKGNGDMGNYFSSFVAPPWGKIITEVYIYNGVTSIGNYAFDSCSNLISITIPDSVTNIGNYAFYDCTSLESITIPDSVTNIGKSAFYNCTSLECITVDSNNQYYLSSDGVLFNKDKTELIQYPIGNTRTSYDIPDSVTNIGESAFYNCTILKNVTIGNNVTNIGERAFYNCTSLRSVTIPDNVLSIGEYAFYNCTSLTSITIPDSVTNIGDYAFGSCIWLTSIAISNGVTSIGDGTFYGCSFLTNITISDSVTSIGRLAFGSCTNLRSITIPDSVTSIGDDAFNYCTSLANVTIGNNVTSIGNYAFSSCTNLTSIIIPNSVASIGNYAFSGCGMLGYVWYSGSNVDRANIALGSANSYLTDATWHYNICSPNSHIYDGECDSSCNKCGWVRTVTQSHSYDNACDSICNGCGYIRSAPHYFKWVIDKQANCGESGLKHEECTVCHTKRKENTVISATGNHSYDNTCDAFCNICDNVRSITHNYEWVIDKQENCGESGLKHEECTVCHTKRNENTEIFAKGNHSYDNTCDAFCNVCGYVRSITHNYEWVVDKQENCGESGLKHEECTICHTKRNINTTIDATGNHTFEWVIDKVETCGTNGTKHEKCKVCAYEQSKNTIINATGNHTFEWVVDKLPDCSEHGVKHEECTVCYIMRNENTQIPALGHTYDSTSDSICNVCGHKRQYFTITYNGNGEVGTPVSQTLPEDISITLPNATSDYYQFLGWSKTPYGEIDYKKDSSYEVTENIILYAKWAKHCYYCDDKGYNTSTETRKETCTTCYGRGKVNQKDTANMRCLNCGSKSFTYQFVPSSGGWYNECNSCGSKNISTGYVETVTCSKCSGRGYKYNTYTTNPTCEKCVGLGYVKIAQVDAPVPIIETKTATSVTLKFIDGADYSKDGIVWQESNVFKNLASGTQYTFYMRYKANSVHTVGDAGEPLYVTTETLTPSTISSTKFTIKGNNISKITAGTKVSSLLSGLNEGSYCKVYKGSSQVSGTTAVGTGMVVKIMDGSTVKATYTIIVTGDTNGDGDISITDMVAIKSHVLGKTSLTGVYATAADTSGEGDVTITDFIQIKAKILGKGTITAR